MRRALLVIVLAWVVVTANAAPAGAHGVGGREPTNVRSRVTALDPERDGVRVRVVEFGTKLALRNTSTAPVTVLGYDDEPYLRVGPDGVFENTRSPAVHYNRSLDPPADVPASFDPSASPEWRQIGDGPEARWHDHRAHWMGSDEPDGSMPWAVPLLVGDEPVEVLGVFDAPTAPPWWPWPVIASLLAMVVVAAARRAWKAVVAVVLPAVLVGEALHVLGSWRDMASSFDDRLGAQSLSVVALAAGTFALAKALRSDAYSAAPWVLFGAVVVLAVGAGDVLVWTRSQIPSSFTPVVVRALVAVVLGGSAGLVVSSARALRAPDVAAPRLGS